jgi:hypothetical protein
MEQGLAGLRNAVFICLIIAGILVMAIGGYGVVTTRNWQDWTRYINKGDAFSADEAILACTSLIQSGKESGPSLAAAFFNRGYVRAHSGDLGRAISDYDQAIRLDPAFAARSTTAATPTRTPATSMAP